MAISGTFQAANIEPIRGASVWGTGINPIHSRPFNADRRTTPGLDGQEGHVPANLTADANDYGYVPEDLEYANLYGYGTETGLADRPRIGESTRSVRAQVTPGYPSFGRHQGGLPGGTKIRSILRGGLLSMRSRVHPRMPIVEGVIVNPTQSENDVIVSDGSQLVVQTSLIQRYKTRAGSQMQSGRQSEYTSPISSRVMGMRRPVYAGGQRHEDMRPREQTPGHHRPFIAREVGTGDPAEMVVNAAYESRPITRHSPALPDTGPNEAELADHPDIYNGGYTDEDPIW